MFFLQETGGQVEGKDSTFLSPVCLVTVPLSSPLSLLPALAVAFWSLSRCQHDSCHFISQPLQSIATSTGEESLWGVVAFFMISFLLWLSGYFTIWFTLPHPSLPGLPAIQREGWFGVLRYRGRFLLVMLAVLRDCHVSRPQREKMIRRSRVKPLPSYSAAWGMASATEHWVSLRIPESCPGPAQSRAH